MLLKRQTEILTSLMDYTGGVTNKITDYSVGSVIRSIYDAVSIEGETLYLMTFNNIQEGIEQGLLSAFNFSPKEAQKAYGDITIEFFSPIANAITIDKGTRFSTGSVDSPIYYETRNSYYIPTGSKSAVLSVQANVAGTIGNVLSGEITYPESTIYNVSRVYNQYPFLTGTEEETYLEARQRFNSMIQSIGKATADSLIYATLSVPGIQLAKIEEFVGYVNIYAGDANGLLTPDLQTLVSTTLDNYRAAGIKVNVLPIDRTALDVTMSITVSDLTYVTNDFKLAFEKYINDYINNLPLNGNFIYNDFVRYVLNFDTRLLLDVTLASPTQNYITGPEEVLRAGNIQISYIGGN